MKILVLGGTQFVGRHIVEELLRGGHSVSLLNRGQSRDELPSYSLPSHVERLRGDRDQGRRVSRRLRIAIGTPAST